MGEDLYREFDHTGDIGIEIEAASRSELFRKAALAIAAIMVEPGGIAPARTRKILVKADTSEDLIHDMLTSLLNLFLADGFIWQEARVTETRIGISVELEGEDFNSSRHRLLTELKAVTYHQLKIEHDAKGRWRARVIFDV